MTDVSESTNLSVSCSHPPFGCADGTRSSWVHSIPEMTETQLYRDTRPAHVAFVCDGNGRWATDQGLTRTEGHVAGLFHTMNVVRWCLHRSISVVSAFLWSTENWTRSEDEIAGIMGAVTTYGPAFAHEMDSLDARLIHLGSRENVPNQVLTVIDDAVSLTSENARATVALAFNYGGRTDIVNAINKALSSNPKADVITEHQIESQLYTRSLPAVDLLIRTGKETRLSNFLLWQSATAWLSFPACYWPDFAEEDLDQALSSWSDRQPKQSDPGT